MNPLEDFQSPLSRAEITQIRSQKPRPTRDELPHVSSVDWQRIFPPHNQPHPQPH